MDEWEIGTVGGFFALRTDGPGGSRGVPLADVYAGDPAPLRLRVGGVAARLRAPEPRIAVSVAHLGLAARLWSIGLGAAVLHGSVPDLSRLRWDAGATTPDDLWLDAVPSPSPPGAAAEPGGSLAPPLIAAVLEGHLLPLAGAVRREYRVAEGLLRGNSGSALAGAVRELHGWARRQGRPGASARATALADALFAHPELRGTGTRTGPAFRRNSCCLYYRCPGGGICGDCCFERPPVRSSVRDTSG